VSLTVNAVNQPPAARNDSYAVAQDATLTVAAPGVLANDTDAENEPLSASLVSTAAHGVLTLNADGSFTYTPNPYFYGTDSFTYQASDGALTSSPATVTINVAKVNHAPTAGDDSYTTDEATPLTVAAPGVLGNDSDPDGDPLTAAVVTGPAHGTLALNANGSFTYTPDANYYGADSFTYRANDGAAGSNVATVNLTANAVAPRAAADAYTMDESSTLTVAAPGVLGNDTTVGNDPLTARLVSGPAHGTLTLGADGSFVYTPGTYYYGTDSFTYQNNDGQFDSNTATVTITINHVNHPPVAAAGPDQTVNEGDTVAFDGSQSSDVDDDSLTYSWLFSDGGTATGATPTHVYGDEGVYTVTLTVDDGHGGQSSSTLKVTVNDVPPTLTLGGDSSVNEGAVYTLALGASDPYGGPISSWQIQWGDGSSQTVPGNTNSVTHVYADGPNDFVISATATDADGTYNAGNTVAVHVNNVAPTAGVSGPTDGVPGQVRTFTLSASDVPADQGNFAFHIAWGDGSTQDVTGPSGTTIDHTFTAGGTYTVQVTAADKDGGAGSPATLAVQIVAAEMQGTTLVVGGTTGNDTIVVRPTDTAGDVSVTINGQSQGTFKPAKVIVYGQAGGDSIQLTSATIGTSTVYRNVLAELFGGDGNDTLGVGGNRGNNVLAGGAGNDTLQGGIGRGVLIGGLGADTINGGGGDDILIGGTTDFDTNLAALDAIMAEWGRTDLAYSARVNDLNGTSTAGRNNGYYLNATTVHDDSAVDQLTGNNGMDWFFALTGGTFADQVHDRKHGEIITRL
jgi:VCBS repeat-containing protein